MTHTDPCPDSQTTHHNERTPAEGGDQFPSSSAGYKVAGIATDLFKDVPWSPPALERWLMPVKFLGRKLFGETQEAIRRGNWYGNDTLWWMVLDPNEVPSTRIPTVR